jgi:PAS domain S-box-containing protein
MIKILAIDDNQDNLISIKALIGEAFSEAQIYTALTGEKGFELASAEDPDVILLDIVMPGMDGFEVCRMLKSDKKLCNIPVVFVTAIKGDKESRIKALECGAEAFLAKPIDEYELTAQIKAMVKIKKANIASRDEKEHLATLVEEKTSELKKSHEASLYLLEKLKAKDEAQAKVLQQLSKSEKSLSALLNNLKAGVVVHAPDTSIIINNPAASILLGLKDGQLRGKKAIDLAWNFLREDNSKMPVSEYPVNVVIATKQILKNQVVGVNRPNTNDIVWLLVNGLPVFDDKNELTEIIINFVDITERTQAQNTITQIKKDWEDTFDSITDAITIHDKDYTIIRSNQAAQELLKLPVIEKQLNSKCYSFYHGTQTPPTGCPSCGCFKSGEPGVFELFEPNLGRYIEIRAIPRFDNQNQVVGLIHIVRDISERKHSEKELIKAKEKAEESESKFKSYTQHSPVAIYTTNEKGDCIYANEKWLEIAGLTLEEALGKGWEQALHPDDKAFIFNNWYKSVESGGSWFYEYRFISKQGKVTWVEGSAKAIYNDVNKVTGYLGSNVDITQRKQAKHELIMAKEKAEESDRLKSAFLANMSHEIRTPLNAIIGFAELVADPDFPVEQHNEFAQLISESGNNLLAIISDIMDISKIEAGQVQIKIRKFSINQLITSLKKEFAQKAAKNGIELRLDPANPAEDFEIESDETKVKQVMTNLLSNAIKFTEKGFIEIGISYTPNTVHISVKDTGIGIPAAYHDKVFERFRQVETSHTRKYGGNGLGLAISKSLVEMLGGTMWIESEKVNTTEGLARGSTFFFSIPIKIESKENET